jgi:hypothetical protein
MKGGLLQDEARIITRMPWYGLFRHRRDFAAHYTPLIRRHHALLMMTGRMHNTVAAQQHAREARRVGAVYVTANAWRVYWMVNWTVMLLRVIRYT